MIIVPSVRNTKAFEDLMKQARMIASLYYDTGNSGYDPDYAILNLPGDFTYGNMRIVNDFEKLYDSEENSADKGRESRDDSVRRYSLTIMRNTIDSIKKKVETHKLVKRSIR